MCATHLSRWTRKGDVGPAGLLKSPDGASKIERLTTIGWSEIVRRDDLGACWEWRGSRYPNGYGAVSTPEGGVQGVHRSSYEVFVGSIPAGMLVCHKCDNRICLNPAHFFLGTHADNTADMTAKGRDMHGVKSITAKLTEKQVIEIRARAAAGGIFQRELAAKYGVSRATIGRVLSGQSFRFVI